MINIDVQVYIVIHHKLHIHILRGSLYITNKAALYRATPRPFHSVSIIIILFRLKQNANTYKAHIHMATYIESSVLWVAVAAADMPGLDFWSFLCFGFLIFMINNHSVMVWIHLCTPALLWTTTTTTKTTIHELILWALVVAVLTWTQEIVSELNWIELGDRNERHSRGEDTTTISMV